MSSMRLRTGRGITLLEVLIANILLGLSMVATANLFAHSAHAITENTYQLRAARLTANLAELLRGLPGNSFAADEKAAPHDCFSIPCDNQQVLQNALHRWQAGVADHLPGGHGQLSVAQNGEIFVAHIQVNWDTGRNIPGQHQLRFLLPP